MNDFPRTGASYPWRKHWKHEYTPFEIPEITFLEDEEIEKYIRENGERIYRSLVLMERRGEIVEPTKNSKGLHSWLCGLCPFSNTEHCPDPTVEWQALEEGKDAEAAFSLASEAYEERFRT